MYYFCPQELKEQIVEIDSKNFIFYDEEFDEFFDMNRNIIDISFKQILIFEHIFGLYYALNLIESFGGIPVNDIEKIEMVKNWFHFICPFHREILEITGSDFENASFLATLSKTCGINGSIFLKTVEKDFHGFISIIDIVNSESTFRKVVKDFPDETFLLSPIISIDEDNLGKKEYRAFIHNGVITSISRTLHKTYHQIEPEVISFIYEVLKKLPHNFPSYFVLDIVSTQHQLDILEFNPIETSAPYLYNSRVPILHPDLLHSRIENIPNPKHNICYSSIINETVNSPTFIDVPGSFSYEYHKALQASSSNNDFSYKVKVKQ